MSELTKIIEKNTKSQKIKPSKEESLSVEKQLDAAIYSGMVNISEPSPGTKRRGRPPKNQGGPSPAPDSRVEVNEIAQEMEKRVYILKLTQYQAYFPETCGALLSQINHADLSLEDLKMLCDTCNRSINIGATVASAPSLIRNALKRTTPLLVNIGKNKPNSVLNDLKYLEGYERVIDNDKDLDFNIKRISIELSSYFSMPSNPYLGLASTLLSTGYEYIYTNKNIERQVMASKGEFSDL